jgi:hypothetical protein
MVLNILLRIRRDINKYVWVARYANISLDFLYKICMKILRYAA